MERSTLEMALVGYQTQASKIEAAMAEIRKELGIRGPRVTSIATAHGAGTGKRVLSAAARQRIAEAQRKRWAKVHAKAAAPKRRLSAATRAKLAANLAKARAAKAAKAAAA